MHSTAIGKAAVTGCTAITSKRSIVTVATKAGGLMVENTWEDAWIPSGGPGRADIAILIRCKGTTQYANRGHINCILPKRHLLLRGAYILPMEFISSSASTIYTFCTTARRRIALDAIVERLVNDVVAKARVFIGDLSKLEPDVVVMDSAVAAFDEWTKTYVTASQSRPIS